MSDPWDALAGCTGFDWDEGNSEKNWLRHKVLQSECEQVFINRPLVVVPDEKHSEEESRHYCLGHTDRGRYLFVVFTVRGDRVRVISARDVNRQEKKVYESRQEESS